MSELALRKIKQCIENQRTDLSLVNCNLTDEDFIEGSPVDVELRKCGHIKHLILNAKPLVGEGTNKFSNPSSIVHLKGLERLICRGTYSDKGMITDMSFVSQLTNLTYLDLSYNQITELKGLDNLKSLQTFYINSNQIAELEGLSGLAKLSHLNISSNRITELKGLDKLTALQSLRIFNNQIAELKGLSELKTLQTLSIIGNKLTDLKGLDRLVNLRDMYIDNNYVTELIGLDKLPALEILSVSQNKIRDLNWLAGLSALRELWIDRNQLTEIKGIDKLNDLQRLNISKNQIQDISPLLPLLQRSKKPMKIVSRESTSVGLNRVNVAGNPLIVPPMEIVKQGNEAVLRYFDKIQEEGVDYLYEAKLTLVGEGSAGKTSLQKRLMNDRELLPKEDNRTRGIKIEKWKYKGVSDKTHTAHIWDFGGQDVYYPVHRFFLTENSVFVLLASTRQTHHNFDYWIPTIFQYGGRSPIILGQTCHQGNKVAWNDVGYYLSNEHFNIIKTGQRPYFEINLLNNNEGLAEIKNEIINQVEKLPHFGKGVPKSWIPAREAIFETAKNNACITLEEFTAVCKKASIKFSSLQDVEDFAAFLHSLGIVLWYSNYEELKGSIILQPEWAMNAVYKIIDDDEIQKRRGNILATDFKRVWNEPYYLHKYDMLKRMLQVFKIAFPKKHTKDSFIIPARLDSMPKEAEWNITEPTLRLQYKFDFMPRGLVNQLSADLSGSIVSDDVVWNNAVNLEHKDTKTQAQVIEDFYNRTITIHANGKDARGLIMLIMETLKGIITDYKGVKPQINVPCSCDKCKSSSRPTLFDYERLLEWSITKKEVYCNEGGVFLPIDELLFSVGLSGPFNENGSKILKAFISYSKFDGELNESGTNYLEDFKKHLAPLITHNKLIQPWDDTLLIAGDKWDDKIRSELKTCDILFLLVSAHFLNTKYITDVELAIAKQRYENEECIIVPIIVSACGWQDVPLLKDLQALPGKGSAIASWKRNPDWHTIDDAWNHVYEEVKKLINEF